jgi:hypothetical protein
VVGERFFTDVLILIRHGHSRVAGDEGEHA